MPDADKEEVDVEEQLGKLTSVAGRHTEIRRLRPSTTDALIKGIEPFVEVAVALCPIIGDAVPLDNASIYPVLDLLQGSPGIST